MGDLWLFYGKWNIFGAEKGDAPKQKHPPFGSFSLPTEFCTLLSKDSNLRISLLLGGSGAGCFPLTLEDTCCDLKFEDLIRSEGKEDAFLAQDDCMTVR